MTEDTNHDKYHASKITVCVTNEDAGGIPIMYQQREAHSEKGQEEIEGEEVGVRSRVRIGGEQVEGIVEGEEQGNDNALADFHPINPSKNVDAIGTKDGKG